MKPYRCISIPVVEEHSAKYRRFAKINPAISEERPIRAIKKLIDIGFAKGWFDESFIEAIIMYGFDQGYWNDATCFVTPFKYLFYDRNQHPKEEL